MMMGISMMSQRKIRSFFFFFSSRRRHTRFDCDWSSDVCSSDLIKHANPCGVAVADDITATYTLAHECDPRSAFGGIVAINRPVPRSLAEALAPVFTEVVVAPAYDEDRKSVV